MTHKLKALPFTLILGDFMLRKLEEKIELEAQAIQIDFEEYPELPKGYLDGELWGFDLVLMWIKELKKESRKKE